MWTQLWQATLETIYMIIVSGFFTGALGLLLGCVLFMRTPGYALLNFIVNIGRSVPYLILMCAIVPVTRAVIGSSIGTNAAIFSLTVAAIPFFARIVENSLLDLPAGHFELARANRLTHYQAVRHIYLIDAMPSLVRGFAVTLINLISYSAMAGAVGGGGLGSLAIHYGYQRFDTTIMVMTVIILVAMVQLVQWSSDWSIRRWFSHD